MILTSSLLRHASLMLTCILLASCKSSGKDAEEAAAGSPPDIRGEPVTSVVVNEPYLFTPEASDEDGDILAFSIANMPPWAEFDTASGRLEGVPGDGDLGEYDEIVISVADADNVVSLPGFSIAVHAASVQDGGAPGGSEAPSIAGEPNRYAVAGSVYAFLPEAADPDGDSLSFSIVNKPAWATFDPVTGRLEGTPGSEDLGESAPIEISVSDDDGMAALSAFTISVESTGSASHTVSWIPPTENEDGTALTDLAGYRIYYGTVAGNYTESVEIDSVGITQYLIDNLAPGRYFLVMTSVNSRALESRHTREIEIRPSS